MAELVANKAQAIQFTKPRSTPRRWAGARWSDTGGMETMLDAKRISITTEARNADDLAEEATTGEPTEKISVLVVDDEPMVRDAIAQILRQFGYCVLEAFNALEAQGLARKNKKINLLLTDFSMPETNGLELVRWFQNEYPETRVLITTASPWELANQVDEHERMIRVLPKPFNVFQLCQMLRLTEGRRWLPKPS